MRINDYFQSITAEVESLRDRVRYLIKNRHWQTDGEWKESVVRQVLRRHLPASAHVGRGFVVTVRWVSRQIDILVFDSTKPVLFRDGDLVFVTPDVVFGVIEVKSRATPQIVAMAAKKLSTDMKIIRQHPNIKAFAGIFAFQDGGGKSAAYLKAIANASDLWDSRVDFVCSGNSRFIRYWHCDPRNERYLYEGWRSYHLPNTAPGYFFNNVIDCVSPESVFSNKDVWFPPHSKEPFCDGEIFGKWPSQRPKRGAS
jgi:hypothetical protein